MFVDAPQRWEGCRECTSRLIKEKPAGSELTIEPKDHGPHGPTYQDAPTAQRWMDDSLVL